ncbi:MAG: hypothetical protein MUP98_07025 [Candidatus Aminicenantes bacterium]|nr:hypothetical protein [Candidatus Aminicenantes bacterium]
MKIFMIVLAALLVTVFVFSGTVELAGTWKGTTEADGNSVDLTLVLKKDADVYSGNITAPGYADNAEIKDVEFVDNKLKFSFTVYNGSEYLEIKVNLSVSENRMTGGWDSEDGDYGTIIIEKTSN